MIPHPSENSDALHTNYGDLLHVLGRKSISEFASGLGISVRSFSHILKEVPFIGNYSDSQARTTRYLEFTLKGSQEFLKKFKIWQEKKEAVENKKSSKTVAKTTDTVGEILENQNSYYFSTVEQKLGKYTRFISWLNRYWDNCTQNPTKRKTWFIVRFKEGKSVYALRKEFYNDFVREFKIHVKTIEEKNRNSKKD